MIPSSNTDYIKELISTHGIDAYGHLCHIIGQINRTYKNVDLRINYPDDELTNKLLSLPCFVSQGNYIKLKSRIPSRKPKKTKQVNQEIVYPFDSKHFKDTWQLWKRYKREQHNFTYKSLLTEQAALKALSIYNENEAIQMIMHSMKNGYKGISFFISNKRNDLQTLIDEINPL